MVDQPLFSDQAIYLSDRHCHCDYSIDAVGTITQYCEAALIKGLKRLTLTTHYDCIPDSTANVNYISIDGKHLPSSPDLLQAYVDDVRRARDQFAGRGLIVECGLEFGWYRGCEEVVAGLRERFRFDWILAGLHEMSGISFASRRDHRACFERYSAETFLELYYQDIASAAQTGLFDAIAHLDYFRKYGIAFYGESLNRASTRPRDEALAKLATTGTAVEVNTSGVRRGAGDWFPNRELVKLMFAAGVKVASLGSDAHRPEDVGDNFGAVSNWIKSIEQSHLRESQLT